MTSPFKVYEPPAFTSPEEVHSERYNVEPYVRVSFPDRGRVDAMVRRWSRTHVQVEWEEAPGAERSQAWVPAGWAQRIRMKDSAWVNPYGRWP